MRRLLAAPLFVIATSACGSSTSTPASPSTFARASPPSHTATHPLVIFLHGQIPPAAESGAREIEDLLRARFVAAGFDVWAPRGRVGLCDWSDDVKQAVCWPSDERRLDVAREIVATWRPQLAARRPLVVGFSNGGAFATLLAAHHLVDACGFVALHGVPAGTLHIDDVARPSPILFVGARGVTWEAGQIDVVGRVFAARNWPRRVAMRDGGHGVVEADLDLAVSFGGGVAGCR